MTPELTELEKSTLAVLAAAGCSECSTILLRGKGGTVNNVRWLRTHTSPAGFRVFCGPCWRKFWNGELNERPTTDERPR